MKMMEGGGGMKGMPMKEMPKEELFVQKWDDRAERFFQGTVEAALPDIDVHYDALIANRRTLDHPEVFQFARAIVSSCG